MDSRFRGLVIFSLLALASGCIVRSFSVEQIEPDEAAETVISSRLKAFLANGEIAVFRSGATVTRDVVRGDGVRYSIDLQQASTISTLPLDSVVGLEAFQGELNTGATVLGTLGATVLVPLAIIGIACAADPKCFGSCPTIYSWDDGEEVLEAEAFSYSIAPLLEGRDVDRLGVLPDPNGVLRLELRNEALETHYINHFEILQVNHEAGRSAYPDETGRPVTVGRTLAPYSATGRDGSSVLPALLDRDGVATSTPEDLLDAVTSDDYEDWVELTFPRPQATSAALVLRLRNSLLTSVLFYDMMLGSKGADALNWLGSDIQHIGEAVELGRWFQETMGLHVEVHDGSRWQQVVRLPDTGPIAWEEVAVRVPVPDTPEMRIRLRSLADEWRIDWATLAEDVRRADATVLPVHSVAREGTGPAPEIARLLAEPDDDYLVTTAATALSLEFLPTRSAEASTFFLSSQGYYTEWIRPEWIRTSGARSAFQADRETVVELIDRWLDVKDDFEERFFATRIPVR